MSKSPEAFRTISEVAQELALPQHVLRFWETRFTSIKPMKRGGGRRYYRPDDVDLLRGIRALLYGEGYTIRGVQRILKEQGPRSIIAAARGNGAPPPAIVPPRPAPADGVRAMPATRPAPAVRRLPEIDEGPDEGDADLRVQPAFAPKEFWPQAVAQPVTAPEEKAAPSAAVRRLEATLAHLLELKRRLDAARD